MAKDKDKDGGKEKKTDESEELVKEAKAAVGKRNTYVREFEMHGLDGSTVDAAVSAQARFLWQKGENDGTVLAKAEAYGEMLTSICLHLTAQVIQFTLLTYFVVGFVQPLHYTFSPRVMPNMTNEIELAMTVNNPYLVPIQTRTICMTNISYPWIHRLMMFILLIKMAPDTLMSIWYLKIVWWRDIRNRIVQKEKEHRDVQNHDRRESPEFILLDKVEWDEKAGPAIAKDLTSSLEKVGEGHHHQVFKGYNKYTAELIKRDGSWRDYDKLLKEWKGRILILSADGRTSFKYKNLKNPEMGPKKDHFPLTVKLTEMDEIHSVGSVNWSWKIFITLFVLLPQIFMNLYIISVGSQLIAYTGTLNKLVKQALKVKFVLKLPELVFEGYACGNLKDYVESTVYYDVVANDKPPKITEGTAKSRLQTHWQKLGPFKMAHMLWESYLSTFVKMLLFMALAFLMYDVGYLDIVDLRGHCTQYFEKFPEIIQPADAYSLW